jgi:hypothetical protein
VNTTRLRIAHGADDGVVGGTAGIRRQHAWWKVLMGSVKERFAHFQDTRIGNGLTRDLWAYTCGITRSDTDPRK